MSKHHVLFLILLCSAVFVQNVAVGESKIVDSTQENALKLNMANVYNKAIGQQSALYNGPAYIPYKFVSKTNANFNDTTSFSNGKVNYDGIVYTDAPLMYDLNKNLLLSHLRDGFTAYSLVSEKVYEFDLFNHHFVRILADTVNKQLTTDFYDELYNSKLRLLVHRSKKINDEINQQKVIYSFVPYNDYYLKKGTIYYEVNSQGKFLDVLKDRKKELKQYIKDNKIRFRDDPEKAMVILATYYDHLTN